MFISPRSAALPLAFAALVLSGCSSVVGDEETRQASATEEAETPEPVDEVESVEEEDPQPREIPESTEPEAAPARPEVAAPATKDPVELESKEPVEIDAVDESVESPETPTGGDPDSDRFGYTPTNDRGNLVKQLGQLAGLADLTQANAVTAELTVTAIEPNFQCTSGYADPPQNGSYLAITFEITTTPALAHAPWPEWYMSAYDLKIISPDGMRENDSVGNSYSCLANADELPTTLGPGERATGKIVLDTAHTSGYLVVGLDGGPNGWEWAY